jgi:predicted lysophospholipase L1 biosynthesis ABC-type transport system permease subunit
MNRLSPHPPVVPYRRRGIPTQTLAMFSVAMCAIAVVLLICATVPVQKITFVLAEAVLFACLVAFAIKAVKKWR